MPHIKAKILGNSAMAAAGHSLVLALRQAQPYEFRLVPTRDQAVVQREHFPLQLQEIMDVISGKPSHPEVLIVQGTLAEVVNTPPGDRPRVVIGALPLQLELPEPWQLEALRSFSQVWVASPELAASIRAADPRVKAYAVPFAISRPWTRSGECEPRPGKLYRVFYTIQETRAGAEEILRWYATRQQSNAQQERLLLIGDSPVSNMREWRKFCEKLHAQAPPLSLMRHLPAMKDRPDLHATCDLYVVTAVEGARDTLDYWATEANAAGNEVISTGNKRASAHSLPPHNAGIVLAGRIRHALEGESLPAAGGSTKDIAIAYVIPHGGRGVRWVDACLKQLRPELSQRDMVVVADLGSDQSLLQELQKAAAGWGTAVSLVCAKGAWNLSRCRNVGARFALKYKPTHLAFLDCDVLVSCGTGKELKSRLVEAPGGLCLALETGNHKVFLSAQELPLKAWPTAPEYVRHGTGNVVMPAKAFVRVGAYDEAYGGRWGSEDIDLLTRLRKAGYQVQALEGPPPAYHQPHAEKADRHSDAMKNMAKLARDMNDSSRQINPSGWGQLEEV